MSEILRDTGLGVEPKGYAKDELIIRDQIIEETAWANAQGWAIDWKLDLDMTGAE